MSVIIRDAAPGDEARWRELWAGYTTFYQVDVPEDVTASVWQRVFSPASSLFMRVAEVDGAVEGFAICLTHEGTWVKEPLLYLEDLFLDARLRGRGIGKALLDDLVAMCKAKGWSRLYWHTNEDNATARKLYDQYVKSDGHVRYRMSF
jgi:GNAT superfamily N-acetyltransferase